MNINKKSVEQMIEEEFRKEMKDLAKRGELFNFEKAMGSALDKFQAQIKNWAEEEIGELCNEGCKKKLPNMWTTNKNK